MENTVAFLISIALICFSITIVAINRLGSSPVWFIFALLPFAVGFLSTYDHLRR